MIDLGNENFIECTTSIWEKCRCEIAGGNNKIYIAENVCAKNISISILGCNNTITINERVIIVGPFHINITGNFSQILIGADTSFEEGDWIDVGDDHVSVSIGNDCMFAMQSGILAGDFHSIIDLETDIRINPVKKGVTIGSHVWIGRNVIILKDVEVGEHSVIGARSIVTKDISSHTIAAGNPARVIRNHIDWDRERLQAEPFVRTDFDASQVPLADDIEFNIESTRELRGLQGWAFIREYDSYKTEVFFEVVSHRNSKVYQARMLPREDVASAFGTTKYLFSGFHCMLCFEEGDIINLILRNGTYVGKSKLDLTFRKD